MSFANKKIHGLMALAAVAAIGLGSHTASAGLLDKIKKGVEKGVKKVKEVVTGGAKKAAHTATSTANKAASVAIKGTSLVKEVFNAAELKDLGMKLANFVTGGEAQIVVKLNLAYKAAKAYLGDQVKDLLKSDVFQKAKTGYQALRAELDPMVGLLKKLVQDKNNKNRIAKLIMNAASLKFDPSKEDRGTVAWLIGELRKKQMAEWQDRRAALAVCSSDKPSFKSFTLTFGISISFVSEFFVGGELEGRWGISADFDEKPGKVRDIRAYWHLAGGIGGGGPGVEAAADLELGLSPLPTENASGGFFGIFAEIGVPLSEVGAGIGFAASINWGFAGGDTSKGKVVAPYAWPGFGVNVGAAFAAEAGGAVMAHGGYAFTINKDGTHY